MTSEQFCYWLQGMFELANPTSLNQRQTTLIKRHLAMVFAHDLDPKHGNEAHQKQLTDLHEGQAPKHMLKSDGKEEGRPRC